MERGMLFPAGAKGRLTIAGFRRPKDGRAAEDLSGRLSRV
jgi:hypothetical protein